MEENELLRLLKLAGFPNPVNVEPVPCTSSGGQDVPWHIFLRRRGKGQGKPAANGAVYGFRIEFPEPVQGPVAVGYASHFGMGGFRVDGGTECAFIFRLLQEWFIRKLPLILDINDRQEQLNLHPRKE